MQPVSWALALWAWVRQQPQARWVAMAAELKGVYDEAVRRRCARRFQKSGARQRAAALGEALHENYIADRLDLDGCLFGKGSRRFGKDGGAL